MFFGICVDGKQLLTIVISLYARRLMAGAGRGGEGATHNQSRM
jgi:hypothetical protein